MLPQSLFSLCRLLPAAAVLAALLPAAAFADTAGAPVTNLVSKQIVVESNGESYHSVPPLANLVADVQAQVDTGAFGRVKSWKVWLGLSNGEGESIDFPSFGKGKSYDAFQRPTSVSRTERLIVPSAAWGDFVKARCNALADDLRSQGLGDRAIFDRDRKLELVVAGRIHADTNGAGSDTIFIGADTVQHLEVVCKKWPGAAIPQAGTGFALTPSKVVNKGLSIYEQYGITGVCKIRLDGWITTDQKNVEVKFRYKNQEGKMSKVWTVNTGESKTATFSHWYNIQDNGFSEGGIELAETGFVRIVGVSHNFRSDWAEYTMECSEGGPQTVTTNLPPKVTLKVVPQGKVMVHGRICPESVKLVGILEGRGNYSGKAIFFGTAFFSQKHDYSITHGQKVLLGADAALRWQNVPAPAQANAPLTQKRRFGLKVTDHDNKIIASVPQSDFLLECSKPSVNPAVQPAPGGLTVEPRQPGAGTAAPGQLRLLPQVLPEPQRQLQRRPGS